MKVVLLAGGYGTRISEETDVKPKPMVEIGGKPILWHIMKLYSAYGFHEFVVCLGYKGYLIKEYFANYFLHTSDVTFDIARNHMEVHRKHADPWKITLVDTGEHTMTGGRLKRVQPYVGEDTFCMTYGDGLSDVNIQNLVQFHQQQNKLATLTAVKPSGRFGAILLKDTAVTQFHEKPRENIAWVSGGFFVLSPKVFDYIEGDHTVWEEGPLPQLTREGQLQAYRHEGFWQPMDTLRERKQLEALWAQGKAPWKHW